MQRKIWKPEKPGERTYIYDPIENVIEAHWEAEGKQESHYARDYMEQGRTPTDEEIEEDVKFLRQSDRVGF